jgi:uncharacterized membrane protein YbhN (UPF0104 family)
MSRARVLRFAALSLVVVVAVVTLHDRLPDTDQVMGALGSARPWYLVLAVLAEIASLRHFALQQRRLLAGFGVGMSLPRALAVTVSRSAISASLPAGSAISAAYAFRQFRTAGATRRAASGVTVLSGLLSGVALLIAYSLVLLLPAGSVPTATLVLIVLGVALIVFGVDFRLSRRLYVPADGALATQPSRFRLVATARATMANLRALPPGSWSLSLLHATVNWATDFACLAAVAAAFGLDVSVTRLATVYLSVQLVRQIPLTPGGTGVIEVALLAGLVSAGSPEAAAAATVLIYRLVSCWVIIPIGGLTYAVMRRGRSSSLSAEPAAAAADPGPVLRVDIGADHPRTIPPRARLITARRRSGAVGDRPPTRTTGRTHPTAAGRRPHG